MPRLSVYVPAELAETVRSRRPRLNVSKLLQTALVDALACRHDQLACARCAAEVDRIALRHDALDAFYVDLMWQLRELVDRVGTAEGAARVAKDVGERHQIPAAARTTLPRPSRAQRRRHKITELDTSSHPSAAVVRAPDTRRYA